MSKKILITGSQGFVGTNLVHKCIQQGIAKIEFNPQTKKWKRDEYESELEIVASKEDISTVIHLGALASTRIKDKELLYGFNYEAVKSIAKFCVDRQILLIFVSSSAIYGNSGTNLSEYARSKLLAEEYLKTNNNLKFNIIRLFNTYGFNEIQKGSMKSIVSDMIISAIKRREIEIWKLPNLKFGQQSRDFIYVKDVVDTLLHLSANNSLTSQTLDLGTGESTSFLDLAACVARQFNNVKIAPTHAPTDYNKEFYQIYTIADIGWKTNYPGLKDNTKIFEAIPKLFRLYRNELIC